MNDYIVYPYHEYEGIQGISKVFSTKEKAENYITNRLNFITKYKEEAKRLRSFVDDLYITKIKHMSGLEKGNDLWAFDNKLSYEQKDEIEKGIINITFTDFEREIYYFDFSYNKFNIKEMEVE